MLRIVTTAGLLFGLAAVAALVALQGYRSVAVDFASLGWGFAILPLAFLPNLILVALSWRLLFEPDRMPRIGNLLGAVWMAFSVNVLLPLGGIGGDVIKARIPMQAGVGSADAIASVIVDKTIDAASYQRARLMTHAPILGVRLM